MTNVSKQSQKVIKSLEDCVDTIHDIDYTLKTEFDICIKWLKWSKGICFIWFNLYFVVEDRRPDLEEYPSKFKTQFGLTILNKNIFSFIGRSRYKPSIKWMDKEV